jgi:hypothetical protein
METPTCVRDIALRIADAHEAGGKGANVGELVAERRLLLASARRHSID